MSNADKIEQARSAVIAAETSGKSQSTINRKYRALFAAQDAAKVAAGGWA